MNFYYLVAGEVNKMKCIEKDVLHRFVISAPICNPYPNMKSLLPRFLMSTLIWNLLAPICSLFAQFEIHKAAAICNPSCPNL